MKNTYGATRLLSQGRVIVRGCHSSKSRSEPPLQEVQPIKLRRTTFRCLRLKLRVQNKSKVINSVLALPIRRQEAEILVFKRICLRLEGGGLCQQAGTAGLSGHSGRNGRCRGLLVPAGVTVAAKTSRYRFVEVLEEEIKDGVIDSPELLDFFQTEEAYLGTVFC